MHDAAQDDRVRADLDAQGAAALPVLLEGRVGRDRRVEQQHAAGQEARLEAARATFTALGAEQWLRELQV